MIYSPIDFYATGRCALCDTELVHGDDQLCPDCHADLMRTPLEHRFRCPVCFHLLVDSHCPYCSGRNVFFDRHVSLFLLDARWQTVLRRWKFENQRRIYRMFLPLLEKEVNSLLEESVSYPAQNQQVRLGYIDSGHSLYRVRNYQPCRDLCQDLQSIHSVESAGDLTKKRVDKQSSRSYLDRFLTTLDGFQVNPDMKEVSTYILVEDVFTTGSTANEAARLLKASGVSRVMVLSVLFRERIED